ncbi:GNAT family N-acetyltransferase [Chitinophaga tropicalis]|uniref:GNAT family N-acetyltransferase n=1 Tax=Chitinophaga tropicalis TaxID=2683588 RepID=A0A7K1TXE6_9BACT|nr:GNAT family N-acetyltransferase [Chitinophaga tropicalis]MVT06779.1 GNAT family N-acetyltransferase [Chitinophaga tropicalis]
MLIFKIIEHGSCNYQKMVELRDIVLRKPLGLSFSEEYLQREINDHLLGCYAGNEGDEILIGCCILSPVNEYTVQLRQMAVHPEHQGKSIGRQLISFAEQEALKEGFTLLMMHARKEAAGFYGKLGYHIEGPEFTEVGIPHYEMSKELK